MILMSSNSQKQEEDNWEMENLIEGFIDRGLDERTIKAYRLDLEHFFQWVGTGEFRPFGRSTKWIEYRLPEGKWEEKMEAYLEYLWKEKGLRFSTVSRKYRVFNHYLSYLKAKDIIEDYHPLTPPNRPEEIFEDTILTKNEVDAFFEAITQEYEELDSDFRKRLCLRDQVMMGLLFYHRVEVSELLRMEVSDYDQKTLMLTIRKKRETDQVIYLFSQGLQKQMAQWLDVHEYFEHEDLYHNRMFLSKLGKPLSMKMITNIFHKYRVLAGIEKECTPKDLKNSLGRYGEELVIERSMGI